MASPDQPTPISETGRRVDAVAEWRSTLTKVIGLVLLFEIVSGLVIYLAPFGELPQVSLIVHTAIGVVTLVPMIWYVLRHWWVRRRGNLSHYQLLGYIAVALLALCLASGVVVTWQGVVGPRLSYAWDTIHLVSSLALIVFVVVHLATIIIRRVGKPEARARLRAARSGFYLASIGGTVVLAAVCVLWTALYTSPTPTRPFSESYNWVFGEDRPFAPSLARVDLSTWEQEDTGRPNALDPRHLAGSAGCGTSGCHSEIYEEWLPSAHRYSSMDDMFQRVQELMIEETSPEHTRYCAGCHDPISLLSGAKNSDNITLSSLGADEGSSCLVCHSIVQADVQGNGDYTIQPPLRYAFELHDGPTSKFVSDFLIRTYPEHHITSYSRPLYKTPEFCGACHKQYIDKEVNTDIGKVQGQNQYDSWKNSRWYVEGHPERTISCRECHMPLMDSDEPARGDATDLNRTPTDGKHRSHRMLASNQYVPLLHGLQGAEKHVALTEQWMRGEYEIPEIAHKWTEGPVIRLEVQVPETVHAGDDVPLRVTLTNNKTGHDFPTGPLDMIESWIELTVTDDAGTIVYHTGGVDESGEVKDSPVLFKADGFDRKGELIDRHNLWDMVGASYKRTMYPGVTDTVEVQFQCPSMARGRLRQGDDRLPPGQRQDDYTFTAPEADATGTLNVEAVLWYRKANPEFLDRVYGPEAGVRSPATRVSNANATITVEGGPVKDGPGKDG